MSCANQKSLDGNKAAMVIWGKALRRIDELRAQLEAGGERGRILTALEWYLRIWEGVDAAVSLLDMPTARRELWLYYGENYSLDQMSAASGYEEHTCCMRISAIMRALDTILPTEELQHLLAWRRAAHRQMHRRFFAPLTGFDLPEKVKKDWHAARNVDWREVERVLRDPGYAFDARHIVSLDD